MAGGGVEDVEVAFDDFESEAFAAGGVGAAVGAHDDVVAGSAGEVDFGVDVGVGAEAFDDDTQRRSGSPGGTPVLARTTSSVGTRTRDPSLLGSPSWIWSTSRSMSLRPIRWKSWDTVVRGGHR